MNESEKYDRYLASREWNEKREAVRKRSGGFCEVCRALPGNAVHHLTYARKYKEPLEDLQHICDACHEFTHAKCDFNPALAPQWCSYVLNCKKAPVPVTLACMGLAVVPMDGPLFRVSPQLSILLMLRQEHDRLEMLESPEGAPEITAVLTELRRASEAYEQSADIPFDFALWLARRQPTVRHDFYEVSIVQVAKCRKATRSDLSAYKGSF